MPKLYKQNLCNLEKLRKNKGVNPFFKALIRKNSKKCLLQDTFLIAAAIRKTGGSYNIEAYDLFGRDKSLLLAYLH